MTELSVRAMSPEEFDSWQDELAAGYAREHVTAGNWTPEEALDRAREATAGFLPQGMATPGMLFLVGELADGSPVGWLWIGLTHPRGLADCAFLYDIEVAAGHRGRGLGRALLAAGERVAREHGAQALELNVFGTNETARKLYETSGYRVVTQQMRKDLRA
ncbi:ribosomal protein S18 acetylase RimI-like enzyme [Micromonospora sp. HB375]|uniref:GNAT family N-acetyltransferase n=1 Tax=unclassified Micromonospora TaxID=2617518 RepID=UPI001AE8AD79|nr:MULTISPECIES: GNAT family N-acetyltransferase [unclassified Micromonospora]MBP1784466.1 ribosomal protein S18 acetylase RimI-like enzyme [Micromonospora sp. HB375]MDH6471568.1 ribosomal protein S18 acetylase RimI-like enzyme [Micromonospora sp. H404/HB375]